MRISLVLALLVAARPALADPQPLSLQAALDVALAHNPELVALRAQLDADARRPEQERYLPPPMLEAQIWQWPLSTPNPAGATYMLMAEQEIPNRSKRALRERLADAGVKVSAASIPVRARDIVADIKRMYAELFVSRKALEISDETIGLLRQIADATQVRYAAGKTPQQDVLKAVLEISRLHEDRVMEREKAQVAEVRLNTLLGREAGASIGPLAEAQEEIVVGPLEELQRVAVAQQPELSLARAETARAEAALATAQAEGRPDFVVRGGYMLMPGDAGAFTAAVGVSWPNAPWSRKRIAAATSQAQLDVTAARARYDAAVNALRLMVSEAHIRLQSAAERAALLRTSLVPQSRQALDVARVGYQADRGDFLDIIDNQRMLAEARLGYYRALADLESARADLERAIGAPLSGGIRPAATQE